MAHKPLCEPIRPVRPKRVFQNCTNVRPIKCNNLSRIFREDQESESKKKWNWMNAIIIIRVWLDDEHSMVTRVIWLLPHCHLEKNRRSGTLKNKLFFFKNDLKWDRVFLQNQTKPTRLNRNPTPNQKHILGTNEKPLTKQSFSFGI